MEKIRSWLHTLALCALAIAALAFAFRGSQEAHAGQPHSALCKDFISPEGVSDLSVVDPVRLWMNEQIALNRDEFMVLHSLPTDNATVVCAW